MPSKSSVGQARRFDRADLKFRRSMLGTVWARLRLPLKILYCRLFGLSQPVIAVLTTNMNCNWSCAYCYGDYPAHGAEKNLSTQEMVDLIDDLARMGCVYTIVHGGEALLRKDIGYVVDYLKTKGIYVCLITNGELFSARIEELRNVDNLTISLDGRPESNDRTRGKGAHATALAAIRLAIREGFRLRVSCTITRATLGDIEYMADLAQKLGFSLTFSLLFRTDFSKPDPLTLSPDEIRAAIDSIVALKRKGRPIVTSYENLEYAARWPYERFQKLYLFEDQVPADFKKLTCRYGKLKYHIEGDGRVAPCTPMASNGFQGKDVREVGLRKALEHVHDVNKCVACPFLTQNDWNLTMDLSGREIMHMAIQQFRELTRLF